MGKDIDVIHCDHLGYHNECTAYYNILCGKLKSFKRCKDLPDCYYKRWQIEKKNTALCNEVLKTIYAKLQHQLDLELFIQQIKGNK